jgi:hypothetical protein
MISLRTVVTADTPEFAHAVCVCAFRINVAINSGCFRELLYSSVNGCSNQRNVLWWHDHKCPTAVLVRSLGCVWTLRTDCECAISCHGNVVCCSLQELWPSVLILSARKDCQLSGEILVSNRHTCQDYPCAVVSVMSVGRDSPTFRRNVFAPS